MLRKIILILIVPMLYLASACSNDDLPPGPRAGGFDLGDGVKHAQIINALEQRKIPYKVNSQGVTVYMLENQAEVFGLIRQIQYDGKIDPNYFESEILLTEEIKVLYTEEFKQASVPYHIDSYGGKQHIFWSQKYGTQADYIRQKLNLELRRLSRIRAVEEGSIPSIFIDSAKPTTP